MGSGSFPLSPRDADGAKLAQAAALIDEVCDAWRERAVRPWRCCAWRAASCWTRSRRRSPMPDPLYPDENPAFAWARALPEPWRSHFPKTIEEAKTWSRCILRRALASRVLAVAVTRIEGTWRAYI